MKTFELHDRANDKRVRFKGRLVAKRITWNLSGRSSRCAAFMREDGGIVLGLDTARPHGGFRDLEFERVFAGLDWTRVESEVSAYDFGGAPRGAFWLAWHEANAEKTEEDVARILRTWKARWATGKQAELVGG